jgi:hypothetical protein
VASPSGSVAPSEGASPDGSPTASPTPSAPPITQEELDQFVAENLNAAFIVSPISGILFGAAVAWYRRFLNLASPARNRRPPPARGKPTRGR